MTFPIVHPMTGKADSEILYYSVILAAPKGSGRTVRSLFREGRGINSSVAVYQDVTGKAEEKVIALGVAIGSGYLYKTTFEKEVYSDLYGGKKISELLLLFVLCFESYAMFQGLVNSSPMLYTSICPLLK